MPPVVQRILSRESTAEADPCLRSICLFDSLRGSQPGVIAALVVSVWTGRDVGFAELAQQLVHGWEVLRHLELGSRMLVHRHNDCRRLLSAPRMLEPVEGVMLDQ